MIELVPVLVTDPEPPVRNAMVGVPVGLRAAVMLMFPVLVPPSAPILNVPADTLFTSAEVSDN